ncbi:MAG: hypothetical protein IPO01_05510 [Chitinophagaceae bacterium]|nr:hypothetical protein [Chitinophagaceae bacterium]MBK7306841.1 hypothetical protein [Chitinophagaceae bacterium]MBK8788493.1 hypothetical protein [Chitinophagaceae bacterium]MBK9484670.1 hypothetical protein [Chitinophagaceae bacterium]MBL0201995.1 hypothetical protein [Chitinophagaceae bacterium]
MKHIPALLSDSFAKGYNIKLLNENTYSWDYPLLYKDGSSRLQFVYLGEVTILEKDYLYIRSFIADFSDKLNAMQLLREADLGYLSCICLKPYTKSDGTQVEGVYAQCVFPVELAQQNKEAFLNVVHEVANRADAIEKKYLGVDN